MASRVVPRVLRSTACVCVLGGLLGLWPVQRAGASCTGPVLGVGRVTEVAAAPVVVTLGGTATVVGEGFFTGCDDTGQGSGCGAPDSEQQPLQDVALDLVQGPLSVPLATSDAGGQQDGYGIRWQVRVPSTFRPGPATLEAGGAVLHVVLRAAVPGAPAGRPR